METSITLWAARDHYGVTLFEEKPRLDEHGYWGPEWVGEEFTQQELIDENSEILRDLFDFVPEDEKPHYIKITIEELG